MYMEDLDLCRRAADAGWVTWYEPRALVTHLKGGTSGRYRTLPVNLAFHYGMYRFYRRYEAGVRSPLVNAGIYTGIGVKFLVSATRSGFNRRVLQRR
jgi:GT2 family glycosyltransferase